MRKIFFEIGLVIFSTLLYLLFPTIRISLIIAFGCLAIWIVPVQLFLSINLQNWLNELGGRFHHLTPDDRLVQIRGTFEGLDYIEASKLRRFYIHVSVFHYVLMILFALVFLVMGIFFLSLGVIFPGQNMAAISVIGFIICCVVGYTLVNQLFPASSKKNIDGVLFLFWSQDWKKRLFKVDQEIVEPKITKTFYDFWLEGVDLDKKKNAFLEFVNKINGASKDGELFKMNDLGKLEIKCVVHAKGIRKSLAGFLKYCIEERHVLSNEILRHSYRELLRDVFNLEGVKNMDFLEGRKYDSTPVDYVKVYRSK